MELIIRREIANRPSIICDIAPEEYREEVLEVMFPYVDTKHRYNNGNTFLHLAAVVGFLKAVNLWATIWATKG